MKEHIKRRIEMSRGMLPEDNTPEYNKLAEEHEKKMAQNPALRKKLKDNFEKAKNTLTVQNTNGLNLGIDKEIRHFLREFNMRAWELGMRKMPAMFNVMEAFFHHDKSFHYFQLLDEEDYLISFFDFIDYYTSNNLDPDILKQLNENIENNVIYNYHVGSDMKELTFKSEDGNEFVIGGVSLVKRGNEITIILLTGQIANIEEVTKKLPELTKSRIAGKENILPAKELERKAEMLNEDPNLWKVLITCRIDLETMTFDSRYIAHDEGNSYSLITDDKSTIFHNGKFVDDALEETYKTHLVDIEKYNSIFELAKAVLHIPLYFNIFEDDLYEEEHETKFKELTKNPIQKRKFNNVDDSLKIRVKPLWILNRNNKFASDRIILRDDKFKIENSGYWKQLDSDVVGVDKKGRQTTGKTWVNITESYFEAKVDELIITKKNSEFEDKNSGYIYIMRNAYMEKNLIKIGLTTNDSESRAQQLSKTSVPDKFYVLNEWSTKDCKLAEKQIHEKLKGYRVDMRREFFTIDVKDAVKIISKIIDEINKAK